MKLNTRLLLYILSIILSAENIHAQTNPEIKIKYPFRNFNIGGMYSYHAKQSLNGFAIAIENEIKLKGKLHYSNSFVFTVHSGVDPKNNMPPQMNISGPTTGPMRFTTGGLQYSPSFKYEIIPNFLKLGVGGLIRYQTTSWPDKYTFFSAETSPFIIPAHYEIYEIHPHTMSLGLNISARVTILHQKKYDIDLNAFMQSDTNKDIIKGAGIILLMHYVKSK